LPWVQANDGNADNFAPLMALDWQVHVYGDAEPELRTLCDTRKLPLHIFAWSPHTSRNGLQRNASYLVRPDGYIALASPEGNASAITSYFDARKLNRASYPNSVVLGNAV
jgi:hypothetical protein